MTDDPSPSVVRILAYLMIDGMGAGATNEDKTLRLSTCGFSNAEVSDLLGIPVGSVNQNLYTARKKSKRPAKKVAAKKTAAKKKAAKRTAVKRG